MIEWWWLIIEAAVLVFWGARVRGWTRAIALLDAYADPRAAKAELLRRWKLDTPNGAEAFDIMAE